MNTHELLDLAQAPMMYFLKLQHEDTGRLHTMGVYAETEEAARKRGLELMAEQGLTRWNVFEARPSICRSKARIQLNLEKLEKLVPGSIVRLSTGEEYRPEEEQGFVGVRFEETGWVELCDLLPLLRDAVKGGAVVVLPGEEG